MQSLLDLFSFSTEKLSKRCKNCLRPQHSSLLNGARFSKRQRLTTRRIWLHQANLVQLVRMEAHTNSELRSTVAGEALSSKPSIMANVRIQVKSLSLGSSMMVTQSVLAGLIWCLSTKNTLQQVLALTSRLIIAALVFSQPKLCHCRWTMAMNLASGERIIYQKEVHLFPMMQEDASYALWTGMRSQSAYLSCKTKFAKTQKAS